MATKTLADKLLIKPGTSLWVSDAAHVARIGPLPADVRLVDGPAEATAALIFVASAAAARELLTAHKEQLPALSLFWVAYPKAGRADINRDTLWPILGEYGMRPISQVAIDEVWSALRFRPLKADEAQFSGGKA